MVKRVYLLIALLTLASAISIASYVNAQGIVYSVDHEWSQIYINKDGTIDLTYNLTLTVSSGVIHSIDIGQPNGDFTVGQGQVVDQYGNQLSATDDSSGGNYLVFSNSKSAFNRWQHHLVHPNNQRRTHDFQ
jgi:hypothetical protein